MEELNRLLKKLIRTGAGRKRFFMAFMGLAVAMMLILSAVQVHSNYNDLLHSKSNQDSVANFLVINKQLNDQNIGASSLSEQEIADIRRQPFVESIGLLTPSRFKASLQSSSERFPFYTDIAFESVPNDYIDVTSKEWKWDESSFLVPIIMPSTFLDMYNLQFSFSQNLPQLTQQMVKMIVFRVNVHGVTGVRSFDGRVVGFSDRISSSLLVPQEFMNWANANMGNTQDTKPSRVIIKTKDPGNPDLVQYLKQKGLVTDADKTRFSRYRKVVEIVVNIAWITGAIMFVFAMLVFTLFIQLTIASCREEIILLVTLGAAPKQLRRFLMRQFFPVNIWVVGISVLLIGGLQYALYKWLAAQNIFVEPYPSFTTIASAAGILLLTWIVNRFSIRRYLKR